METHLDPQTEQLVRLILPRSGVDILLVGGGVDEVYGVSQSLILLLVS